MRWSSHRRTPPSANECWNSEVTGEGTAMAYWMVANLPRVSPGLAEKLCFGVKENWFNLELPVKSPEGRLGRAIHREVSHLQQFPAKLLEKNTRGIRWPLGVVIAKCCRNWHTSTHTILYTFELPYNTKTTLFSQLTRHGYFLCK